MRTSLRFFFILCVVIVSIHSSIAQEKRNINTNWFFHKGEVLDGLSNKVNQKQWTEITLPHTYNPSGSAKVYKEQKKELSYRGTAWYKKNIFIDANLKHKRLFLRFDGAYIDTDVYINGKKIGNHKGGYTAFVFEITDAVNYGKNNLISVRVNNEYNPDITPLGGGYLKFGGITRPVWLEIKESVCISPLHYASTGVYCKPLKVNSKKAKMEVEVLLNTLNKVRGTYKVICSVLNAKQQIVTEKSSTGKIKTNNLSVKIPLTVKNPNLWNGLKNPNLYKIKVTLYHNSKLVDTVTETTGFRTFYIDNEKGFILNGESYPLYGAAIHQYYPGVGSAMKKEHFEKDAALMEDIGLTSIRLSHYPHSKYRLDLCDQKGVVAYSELAWIKEFFGTTAFKNSCIDQTKEMVYQLYNHPSIAIWGLFNEIRYDTFKGVDALPLVKELNAMIKEIDPSRLTSGVSWKSGKRNDIADLSGWNRYQGWYWNAYPGSPNDFTWIDNMKKEFPNRVLGITEYGAGGAINHFDENRKVAPYNKDQFHPVDFYNYSHEEHFKEMEKRPWLWGKYIWTLTEFLVPNYNQGRATFVHDKGLVAENRIDKKDAYFLYKANWKKEPILHLAYKQFITRLNDNAEVTVYSNLKAVTLKVNGIDYGTLKQAPLGIYKWSNIPLKNGENNITVNSEKDGKSYEEKAVWNYIKDIHNNSKIKEIVASSTTWNALFKESGKESKKRKGTGVPGEEINAAFDANKTVWNKSNDWKEVKLPLYTKTQTSIGNWTGKTVYFQKEFDLKKELNNPFIYLKQTARLSKGNGGRVSIAIDGEAILTIEEGFEDYRLIPVIQRLGKLKKGKHIMSVIANKPEKGILDVGLVDIKKD